MAEEVNRSKTCETTLMLQTQEDYKTSFSLSVGVDVLRHLGAIFLPVPRGTVYQALGYRDSGCEHHLT